MDVTALWELFDEVSDAVRSAVALADRRAVGHRDGQYALDLDADAVVVAPLLAAGFGVMSEESGLHRGDRQVCVVVDPVDGSTNASRDLPSWATSLCAVDEFGPFAATVVDHSRRTTYRAARGSGATRDWRPVGVARPAPLDDAIVGLNGWSPSRPACRQFRALGSAALELCMVAEGALDGYMNLDTDSHGSWDYLGGLLVLTEAGGVAQDHQGRELVSTEHGVRRTIAAASCLPLLTEMMGS